MKITFYSFALICILSVVGFAQVERVRDSGGEGRLVYKDCGVPYEMVLSSVSHYAGQIFLLTESKYFNEKDLSKLFGCLSKKHPEFSMLGITLFDDRPNLDAAIRSHTNPRPDANPPDNYADEDCADVSKARAPCPLGYNRAIYFRFDDREFYDFSEDPNRVPLKRVTLKNKD